MLRTGEPETESELKDEDEGVAEGENGNLARRCEKHVRSKAAGGDRYPRLLQALVSNRQLERHGGVL